MGSFAVFWDQFISLVRAPVDNPEMIWIVLPLLIVITLMTFYFSRYKEEELGWNTALGNSLILIFVSLDLFREIYHRSNSGSLDNLTTYLGVSILVSLLLIEGIILLFVNFTHLLPKKISYLLSSPLAVNLIAYVVISIVYSNLKLTFVLILAALIFLALLVGGFWCIGFLARRWWIRVEHLKRKEKVEDVRKATKIIAKEKKEIEEHEKKIRKAKRDGKKEVAKNRKVLKEIHKASRKNKKK